MRVNLFFLIVAVIMWGCLDEPQQQKPHQPTILDNLPVNDRDLLLAPLEHAMDDLRANIVADESFFASSVSWRDGHMVGRMEFKLDGPDTMMVRATIIGKTPMEEEHFWFYDKEGQLFFSEHHMRNMEFGYETTPVTRDYKFYFEETGSLLSSYGKVGYNTTAEEEWAAVCLTEQEEKFLQSRLIFFCQKAQRETVIE
ncbi:MAG: hypothetical protein R2813_03485 [Flavobacteriales bacterium]